MESRAANAKVIMERKMGRVRTTAFVYNFILFSSEILKILFMVVKETRSSYVMLMNQSLSCTWAGTRRLIYCLIYNDPHILIYSDILNDTHQVYEFYWYVAIENTIQFKKLPSIVYSFG